jgi:hypothetical protein
MALKIIGAGFGRTGTLSLKVALEKLGYDKTHHMEEVLTNGGQVRLWHDIGAGKTPDWDHVFEGCQACVDFPASTYYKELFAHYPDAKVVLTVRDVDRWYQSTFDTIYRFRSIYAKWARALIPAVRKRYELVESTVWDRVFDGRFEDKTYAKQVFLDYIEDVKNHIPKDRLLVFEVAEGWEPLCEFLGLPVPGDPFPRLNDTATMRRMQNIMQAVFTAIPLLVFGGLAYGIYGTMT